MTDIRIGPSDGLTGPLADSHSGDTIWMETGVYGTGCTLFNVPEGVTVRSNKYSKPWLKGFVKGLGQGISLLDLEIGPVPLGRTYDHYPTGLDHAIEVPYANLSVRRCLVHDGLLNVADFFSGVKVYQGNLFYNAGAIDNAWYNFYSHNHNGGERLLDGNILLASLRDYTGPINLHMYSDDNRVRDYTIRNNMFVHSYSKFSCGLDMYDILYTNNFHYDAGVQFGRPAATVTDRREAVATYNYFMNPGSNGSIIDYRCHIFRAEHNESWQGHINYSNIGIFPDTGTGGVPVINYNIHHNTSAQTGLYEDPDPYDFAGWQALGYDLSGSWDGIRPSANKVVVIPDPIMDSESSRVGIVYIFNWAGLATVSADISALSLVGSRAYRLVSALNPSEGVDFFGYQSGSLSIPFGSGDWSVKAPAAEGSSMLTTYPDMGIFLVEEISHVQVPVDVCPYCGRSHIGWKILSK